MSARKTWREIIDRPGVTLLPGAYDALSARLIEKQGFEALLAGGYAALGSMLAAPDHGQSNMRDMADHYARVCNAVSIPVFVDADTGFGGVHNVAQAVRAFEAAGAAAIFIGDQVFPNRCGYLPGKDIVPVESMLARLYAALDARTDPDLFIAARTDAFAIEGLDAAIERCQLFMEAGADLAIPQGVDEYEAIERVLAEVPGRHIANQSHAAGKPKLTLDQLEQLGVTAVIFPSALLFAAAGGVVRALEALKRDRAFDAVAGELMALEDYYAAVGLEEALEKERLYDEQAAGLVKGKPDAAV